MEVETTAYPSWVFIRGLILLGKMGLSLNPKSSVVAHGLKVAYKPLVWHILFHFDHLNQLF